LEMAASWHEHVIYITAIYYIRGAAYSIQQFQTDDQFLIILIITLVLYCDFTSD